MFKKLLCLLGLSVGIFAYDSIDEALKNGVTKGDFILYGDYQKLSHGMASVISDKDLATYSYLGNTGYFLGNVRLGYTSGFYKNIRASISFAAALSIYNHHKNLMLPTGKTDSQKDFFNTASSSIAESFLEYFDGDTNIKIGRININNEWINTLTDGFWFRNKTVKNLLLEVFWARTYGRIDYYQMTNFNKINLQNSFGIANIGAKYNLFEDLFSIKAYSYFAPKLFSAFGIRLQSQFATKIIHFGGETGITYSIEHQPDHENGYEFDINAFIGYKKIIHFKAGYIHTSKKTGWGSLGILGDKITPFFVWGGKAIRTQNNANLFYGTLSSKIQQFTFSLTYGTTSFGDFYRQNEIDFTTEIGVTNNIFVLINLLNTHLDSSPIPTLTQINGGLRLRF